MTDRAPGGRTMLRLPLDLVERVAFPRDESDAAAARAEMTARLGEHKTAHAPDPERDEWRVSGLTPVLVRDGAGEVVLMARTPELAAKAVAAVNGDEG